MEREIKWQAARKDEDYNQKGDEKLFSSDPIKSLVKESAQNSLDAVSGIEKQEIIKKYNLFNFKNFISLKVFNYIYCFFPENSYIQVCPQKIL